jgi:hypothetical protein
MENEAIGALSGRYGEPVVDMLRRVAEDDAEPAPAPVELPLAATTPAEVGAIVAALDDPNVPEASSGVHMTLEIGRTGEWRPVDVFSEPAPAALSVHDPLSGQLAALSPDMRRGLKQKLAAGELDELSFRAVTFKATYPNANCLRFRDEDLDRFAASYAGQPFLRDHEQHTLAARGGTITACELEGNQFVTDVRLTVPEFIGAFLNQTIDRFSIGWNYTGVTCSVCGASWMGAECNHWPGRKYPVKNENGRTVQVLCELIFEGPTGKEISAVNTPAVAGTGVRGMLADLVAAKLSQSQVTEVGQMEEGLQTSTATETVEQGATELMLAMQQSVLDNRLHASGLPVHLQDLVRESLRPGWRVAELDASIDRAKGAWAKLEAGRTIKGVEPVTGMVDSLDQMTEALTALLEGRRPKGSIQPLSGIREGYIRFSGDYDMKGLFVPENVGLASVNSTTMANIVANVMNKRVINIFQTYPRWWSPIVLTDNFGTLQTVQWITLGGIGALPTVAEGAAYTELTWDDAKETASWVKKGGYLGITLEAMDKDDVSRLRSAPQALAQSAWLTLGKAVSAIFTSASGLGPTLADTGTLFNATAVTSTGGHANLTTSALSTSAWAAAKLAMRKQVEVNSGERLGALTSPRYLMVPPDLENTALTILASEGLPGGANNDINPEAEGSTFDARMQAARRRIIVVDLWTDTNNWAAVADPMMYPTIGIGYRYGETPEIFSVATPNSGLMFTNDVMPIKVRYFFACGPMDYRGLYKGNVT